MDTVFGSDSSPTINNTRSQIKTYIEDTWYTSANGIAGFTSLLEASAGYCNDRSVYQSYYNTTALTSIVPYVSSSTSAYFGAYGRNLTSTNLTPSLNCPRSTVDLYRYVENSTGVSNQLKYPAALLTADEASFAGSGANASSGSAYHDNSFLRSGSNYHLFTPAYGSYGSSTTYFSSGSASITYSGASNSYGVRPVISLKSGVTPASGSGTATDPWVIEQPSTCNPSGTTISTIGCMQDISSSNRSAVLNSMVQNQQYKLIDNRDNKEYWVAKLADGNVWMTQNLDLEIGGGGVAALTSENTDLNTSGSGAYITDYSTSGGVITWSPNPTNITPGGATTTNNTLTGAPATISNFVAGSSSTVTGWAAPAYMPYMADGGDRYVYTSGASTGNDNVYNSKAQCMTNGGHTADECAHYHVGNYYNWSAAIASSASKNINSQYAVASNSICPKGWRLPKGSTSATASATTREVGQLWYAAGIISSLTATQYATNGFINIRQAPLYYTRAGMIVQTTLNSPGGVAYLWSASTASTTNTYASYFQVGASNIYSNANNNRYYGYPIRCLVRL